MFPIHMDQRTQALNMIELKMIIKNERGLHARASAKLVEVVESFDADCEISKNNVSVSGDSIMGLLMLAASKGSCISIKVWGNQCKELLDAIRNLVENRFNEDS